MNTLLQSVYGGAQPPEPTLDEMTKMAAEAVEQSLAQNGIDINSLSEEDLNQIASEITGADATQGADVQGMGSAEDQMVQAIMNDPQLLEQVLQADPELATAIAQAVGGENPEGAAAAAGAGAAPPPQAAAPAAPPQAAPQGGGEHAGGGESEGQQKAASVAYNERVKEAARQVAAADFTGRIIAWSMHDELNKIAAAYQAGQTPTPPAGFEPAAAQAPAPLTYQDKIAAIMNGGQLPAAAPAPAPVANASESLRIKIGQAVVNQIQAEQAAMLQYQQQQAALQKQASVNDRSLAIQQAVRQAFGINQ